MSTYPALPYSIIELELEVSRMGPLRLGPKFGTNGLGKYKTPVTYAGLHPRAAQGRAKHALVESCVI